MLSRRDFVSGCLAGGLFGLAACSKENDSAAVADDASTKATLSFCMVNPTAIDPYNTEEPEGRQVTSALFEPLTVYDWQEGVLKGAAATSWESSEDELEFTFHLVEDATFHNGERVTAQSFKRAWERICDPTMDPVSTLRSHLSPVVGAEEMANGEATEIKGIKAADDYTLVVTLKAPMADFPYVCSHCALSPVPQAALDDPRAFARAPIGNGPFKIDGMWRPDLGIRIVRNDDFHGLPATLDRVQFSIVDKPETAFSEFVAGRTDFAAVVSDKVAKIREECGRSQDGYTVTPEGRMITGLECAVYYLLLNCEDKVLCDVDVRRALSLAIDRKGLCDYILGSSYKPANTVVPPSLDDDRAVDWEDSHYDVEAAKALLEKKFPANENGTRDLTIQLRFNKDGGHKDIIDYVANNLKEVGISVDRAETSWAVERDALAKGSFQVARFGWSADYPTVDNFLYPQFYSKSDGNYSRYANEEVDKALLAARQTRGDEERKQAYREVCARIGADMPIIPLLFTGHNHVGSKRIKRLYYDPQGRAHFEDAQLVAQF